MRIRMFLFPLGQREKKRERERVCVVFCGLKRLSEAEAGGSQILSKLVRL